jgi:hypothetical protein
MILHDVGTVESLEDLLGQKAVVGDSFDLEERRLPWKPIWRSAGKLGRLLPI